MSDTLTCVNGKCIYEIFNLTTKIYPGGFRKLRKNSFDTIKGRVIKNKHNGSSTEEELEKYLKKRVKERKQKIIDLAFCNSWKYFVTLTFDTKNKEYFPNGYSHEQAILLLRKWINNQHHQNKHMRYVIVSEFHKESGNLHFHGLFNNVNWSMTESINPHTNEKIIKNGCQIYNLDNYKLGFTTISEIKDSRKVSVYLSKYITKDLISLKNKKVFWYSRNLEKPIIEYSYIVSDLKEYLKDSYVNYYNTFSKDHCKIEVAEINH